MKVWYTRQAITDLLAIADYIRERNPAAAVKVERPYDRPLTCPKLGRDRPELDARALVIPRYPYTAYYRIEGDAIWIVHIRHQRRRPVEPGDLQ